MHPPGVYLHVPFCAALCHYCDFNRVAGSTPEERADYVRALVAEVAQVAGDGPARVAPPGEPAAPEWPPFGSVFVGGGTPTMLTAEELAGVIRAVRDHLPLREDAEITVEANPETVDAPYFAALAGAGVNRVSMGAQSFAPHVLDELGRWHEVQRPLAAVADARAGGIERVSLDLIYGAPSETAGDWAATLDTALATGIEHISAYALTVEASTEYAARIRQGAALAPDEDVQAERMAAADARLSAAGLRRYEVSNWARPGHESRHNLAYWRGASWLAFGAGAHGHWEGRRWWNVRPPGRYTADVLAGVSPVAGDEVLDAGQRRLERLLMGLRLAEGVPRGDVEPIDERAAAALVRDGLLLDGPRLRLTADGWALANEVIVRLAG
jgi:putative oxygen-independent coproporphyrinogen III oxidase